MQRKWSMTVCRSGQQVALCSASCSAELDDHRVNVEREGIAHVCDRVGFVIH